MFEDLYAQEKMENARQVLATHPGPIHDRLGEAYLELVSLDPGEIPEQVRADVVWIKQRLTHVAAQGEGQGHLAATLAEMSETEAVEIATRICMVADRLADLLRD